MNTTSRENVSKTDERIDKLADQLSTLVEIVSKKVVTPAPVKAVEEICVTCSGPHAWYNCPNTDNNQASVSNQMAPPGFAPVQNNGQNRNYQNQGQGNNFNRGNNFHVERETEETTDKEQTNFQGSTAHIPPPVNPIPILEPDVPKTLPKPNIPYPSRRNDQKFREKASYQKEKIFQMFQDLRFDIRLKYSSSYDDVSINQIDVIDEVCEEYAPELLGFSNKSSGGNPTPTSKPLTSGFILEEIEAYLKDDSISPK
ncbi:hypothetical protein Tco_0344120 [Tanacetum coccineum]